MLCLLIFQVSNEMSLPQKAFSDTQTKLSPIAIFSHTVAPFFYKIPTIWNDNFVDDIM